MDEEDKKKLDKLLAIAEQTNRVVRRMRHEVLIMRFIHVFYWLIILAIILGVYYYLQPYIIDLMVKIQTLKS